MRIAKYNNNIIGVMCAIGCETLYGLSYIFTKRATELAGEFALLGWRFLIAVLFMSFCIVSGFVKINLRGKSLKALFVVALFSPCMYFIGETVGISHTTASESGVFLSCIPIASLVASTLILKEKPSRMQIRGISVTLMGVLVTVFALGASSSLSAKGYLFLVTAVISYALYSVFVDRASDFSGVEITYIMLVAGAVLFIFLALIEAKHNDSVTELITLPFKEIDFLGTILYQGLGCSVLAFFLSNVAISKIGVNRTASFIGLSTVVSILAWIVLLQETFTGYQIGGAIVIMAGVYIANMDTAKRVS